MSRFFHSFSPGIAFFLLAACGGAPAPAPSQAPSTAVPRDRIGRIAERYWDERTLPGDRLSPQFMADSLVADRRYLADVVAQPRAGLDPDSQLTYDILKRRLELDIEEFTYPSELTPVNPFEGMPQRIAYLAADMAQHPPQTAKDYENWLLQIENYAAWSRRAIANMREGMRRGYTSPRPVVERELPLLQALGADSAFRLPPQTLDTPEETRLAQRLSAAVSGRLLPASRELHDFMQKEYLPRARATLALSALPLGQSWYLFRVKRATGVPLSPNEIHAVGVAEVERIHARMALLPPAAAAGAPSGAAPPAGAADPLSGYPALKAQAAAALPTVIAAVPAADFDIRDFTPLGQAAALIYRPAPPDGLTAAVLYVNAAAPGGMRPPAVDTALFFQEALPGRHLQSALQQERTDLPKFRRFGGEPAFTEGWALYAMSLGEESGLVRDDEVRRGILRRQLSCAAALVVDTGVHSKGWTREQAIDYLRTQTGAETAAAGLAVDRFAALPGDALACKMGELKFQALRHRAESALGARFDLREFHLQLLKDGAMPLDILDAKIKLWTDART